MSRSKPFIIHPGHGGLVGAAQALARHSRGENNEAIYRWLEERMLTHGAGRKILGEDSPLLPVADLLWDPSDPQAVYGWAGGQVLPFPGANDWFPQGPAADGLIKCAYRNTASGVGTYWVTGGGTGGLPFEGDDFFGFNSPSGASDSWNANQNFSDYIANEGVTSPNFAWFIVCRKSIRRAAAGAVDLGMVCGSRKLTATTGGYALIQRSPENQTHWEARTAWIGQDGTARSYINPEQVAILSGAGANAVWVVYAVQFEENRIVTSVSQDYFDAEFFATDANSRVKHRTDTGSGRFQFFDDGSLSGGNDNGIAEARYFDRQLTPQEFNLVVADLLVKYGIDPR